MDLAKYLELKGILRDQGYGEEFEWAQSLTLCETADEFFTQYCWVVISGGLKNQVAQIIWERVDNAVKSGKPISNVFQHKGKCAAIETVWIRRDEYFRKFKESQEPVWYLESLPYIGPTTKFHLARDLGLDCVKPDRHLVRIAAEFGMSAQLMCETLSKDSGDRIGAVDIVIWRAANLGLV